MSAPQPEKLWEGGSTLKLITHVFEIALKRRNKYKELFETLVVTFQQDAEKSCNHARLCCKRRSDQRGFRAQEGSGSSPEHPSYVAS